RGGRLRGQHPVLDRPACAGQVHEGIRTGGLGACWRGAAARAVAGGAATALSGKSHRRTAFRLLQLSSSKETTRMHKHLLNRRQFSARCAAFGLSFPALSAMIAAQATAQVPGAGAASKPAARTV